jgi:hypothetical protein
MKMSNQYGRQELAGALELLIEIYPNCFADEPAKRRPLKENIIADIIKDGIGLSRALLHQPIDDYQRTLRVHGRRIDLNGKEVGTDHAPITMAFAPGREEVGIIRDGRQNKHRPINGRLPLDRMSPAFLSAMRRKGWLRG